MNAVGLESNKLIELIPFAPFFNPSKNSGVELPIGDKTPVPVITTRFDMRCVSLTYL